MRSSSFKCLFTGLLLLMWGSVHWSAWLSNQRQAKSNWIQPCSLWAGYAAVGCSKKNLVAGHSSIVNHFSLQQTHKHGEDAVAMSLAYRSYVLALWKKWRKGIVGPCVNPSNFKVALAPWELCQPTRLKVIHSAALPCAGGGFWESDGLCSSSKLSLTSWQLWLLPSKCTYTQDFSFPVSYSSIADSTGSLIPSSPAVCGLPTTTVQWV